MLRDMLGDERHTLPCYNFFQHHRHCLSIRVVGKVAISYPYLDGLCSIRHVNVKPFDSGS